MFKSLELLKSQRNRAEISGRSTPSSRGVVMRCSDVYALFAINPHPSRFISLTYFGNVYLSENLLSGFMVLARKEYFQRRRFSRCVLELLPQTSNCILNAARPYQPQTVHGRPSDYDQGCYRNAALKMFFPS